MKNRSAEKSPVYTKLSGLVKKYKYILIVIAVGAVILMLPSAGASKGGGGDTSESRQTWDEFPVEEQEKRLCEILSSIDGAGRVRAALSLDESAERRIARNNETGRAENTEDTKSEAVIISSGSGTEEAVTLKYLYPTYRGAVVAAEGAQDPEVRLSITQAVSSFTGLSTDKITVVKMEKGQEDK